MSFHIQWQNVAQKKFYVHTDFKKLKGTLVITVMLTDTTERMTKSDMFLFIYLIEYLYSAPSR